MIHYANLTRHKKRSVLYYTLLKLFNNLCSTSKSLNNDVGLNLFKLPALIDYLSHSYSVEFIVIENISSIVNIYKHDISLTYYFIRAVYFI
jgi:hypothetical protein